MRVLVVEDEVLLAETIAVGLRRHSLAVDVAVDGQRAVDLLDLNHYDVVVLDRDIPIVHGDDVCRHVLAADLATRVLMLTAADDVGARVCGLDLGADDYLTKPFAFAELVSRVRAAGRRCAPRVPPRLERRGVVLDTALHQVSRDGRFVPLSAKEFAVLEELLRAQGGVLSAEQLLERAWDENIDPFTNVVRVTIQTLRRKLADPPVIETIRGVGYQIR